MSGDSGDIYQYRLAVKMRNNPDWKYEKMSQTEIENDIKRRSTHLTSRRHSVTGKDGKKIKFTVSEKNIEHLVSDALHRAKGTLMISDIPTLHKTFDKAEYIKSKKDEKGNGGVTFHYFKINIAGRTMYLNIREDKNKHQTTLHSVSKNLK